ncbi:MBL fold metallo-hydrolase [Nioella nitratireducens]|uniref:MBL fold metallo-hydrolase n=1 Tax=Nioella nitratireducens TaxID=1287720 RepID=UPI0008FD94BE|nr:MBL fold metallo-hydrolase [Nioella nitratireducens]
MTEFSRRTMMKLSLATPFLGALSSAARAEAPSMGASFAHHRRFTLGGFEVTTLLAGTTPRENPQGIFGTNVSEEEFAEVSAANFLSTDVSQFYFTPVVVNTGAELILFDTGLNPAGITAALTDAGYSAEQVDTVVLTHMHGDHIGGLSGEAGVTFPNARYVTGRTEFDHWAGTGNDGFEAKVRPLADSMTFLEPDQDVASGITSVQAYGHTPGHMGYHLESQGARLMLFADLANHPVWSLAHPEWEVLFDSDKEMAAASRRRVLDMLAADRIPAIGYHMPFPGIGFVETRGDGFRWVPESGQLMG